MDDESQMLEIISLFMAKSRLNQVGFFIVNLKNL